MSNTRRIHAVEDARRPFYFGVDLGGTNIKIGLVDDLGRVLAYRSIPTDPELGVEAATERMGRTIGEITSALGVARSDIARVGLGTPGSMDLVRGILVEPVNLPTWRHFPIRDRLSHHAGLPVTYVNDASAATFGEFWTGRGAEFSSLILITLGTGVGCGIIVNNRLVNGIHSGGAECGHMIIFPDEGARLCSCGQTGHLEAYSSGTAVKKRTEEALETGRESSLIGRIAAGEELSALMVAQEAERDDSLSNEIVLETARILGIGIVTIMHTVDPAVVLLGGAVTYGGHKTATGRRFLARIQQEVSRRALPLPARGTVIDFASLGGDAGFIGAAGLAREEHRELAGLENSPVA